MSSGKTLPAFSACAASRRPCPNGAAEAPHRFNLGLTVGNNRFRQDDARLRRFFADPDEGATKDPAMRGSEVIPAERTHAHEPRWLGDTPNSSNASYAEPVSGPVPISCWGGASRSRDTRRGSTGRFV